MTISLQTAFEEKLNEVKQHYAAEDFNIAFRKLVDTVLDTEHLPFFQKLIEIANIQEKEGSESRLSVDAEKQLLNSLENFSLNTKNELKNLISSKKMLCKYGRSNFQMGPIDIELEAGKVLGLVGENGNGKTTLLRALALEIPTDSGEIQFPFLEHINNRYDLRARIVYMPQRTPVWYGSLRTNLKFAATNHGYTGEKNELYVNVMMIRFGLWKFRNHQWSELSSGYKMRFELARTFLRRPNILLLDEPLGNLDVLAQQLILEDLENMSKSLSNPLGIILSSQQLFEVEKIADDVIFLRNGKPQFFNEENNQVSQTIIECDLTIQKQELDEICKNLPIENIEFKGGVFMVKMSEEGKMNDFLDCLVQHKVQITYVRDISKSTRRLFIN